MDSIRDFEDLIRAKRGIDNPRHREDLRVLLEVKRLLKKKHPRS